MTAILAEYQHFNSQPHKEADDSSPSYHSSNGRYFNSQPHKEADKKERMVVAEADISTHSLTRRLTQYQIFPNLFRQISTHSLTRRLTAISDKNIFIQN